MTELNSFPIRRLRRFREKEFIRKILQEHKLNVDDLIYPIFVSEDITEKKVIKSMPGIYRHSPETILYEIEKCSTLKIPAVAIFPVINQTKKDNEGSEACNEDGLVPKVIKKIKNSFPLCSGVGGTSPKCKAKVGRLHCKERLFKSRKGSEGSWSSWEEA